MSAPLPMAPDAALERRIRVGRYQVAKLEEEPSKSDDACQIAERRGLFAVADGTGVGNRSGDWARALVDHACRDGIPPEGLLDRWLEAPRREWLARASSKVGQAWIQKAREQEAGAATLALLEVTLAGEHEVAWRAAMVGDSC